MFNLNNDIDLKINNLLNKKSSTIHTLVLSGGGINGIVHLGALKYLDEINILQNITTFIGTSIGAIISGLFVIGYTIDELFEFTQNINFGDIFHINPINILDNLGFNNGEKFTFILTKMFQTKNISETITFK